MDLYYLIDFAVVLGFLAFYARRTNLDHRAWVRRRLGCALVFRSRKIL